MLLDGISSASAIAVTFVSGGSLMGILSLLLNKKKTDAETRFADANTSGVLTGAAMQFVAELRQDVSDLRTQSMAQTARALQLTEKIKLLEDHIRLQTQIIFKLRDALAGYDMNHPLLVEKLPTL